MSILHGDCRDVLPTLPAGSVQCVVTSPPYFGLRNYDVYGQIGLDPTIDAYVETLVAVFREVRRVLRDDGTVWLNLGDNYAATGKSGGGVQGEKWADHGADYTGPNGGKWRPAPDGLKPKDLCMIPARVALALQADGWWIRSEIIWAKGLSFCPAYSGSVMPESVTDRPTSAYEKLYLLTKSASYFYDAEAVREAWADERAGNPGAYRYSQHEDASLPKRGNIGSGKPPIASGRNLRNVWAIHDALTEAASMDDAAAAARLRQILASVEQPQRNVWAIGTEPTKTAHYAAFPMKLVEPCIKAGTSAKGQCVACGAPWVRVVERGPGFPDREGHPTRYGDTDTMSAKGHGMPSIQSKSKTTGWQPSCGCYDQRYRNEFPRARSARHRWQQDRADRWFRRARRRPGRESWLTEPQTVLDPFGGTGTVAIVAQRLGRRATLIELNPDYAQDAAHQVDGPLFAETT